MSKSSSRRSLPKFPDDVRTRAVVGEFGVGLLEPDEWHKHWGYRWVLDVCGVQHPCENENDIWCHFEMYMIWWYDNCIQYDYLTIRYREGDDAERQALRAWTQRSGSVSELPYSIELSKCLPWRGLQPWDDSWLAEMRKRQGHPLYLSHYSVEVHLQDAFDAIDAERERDSLRSRLAESSVSSREGGRL
ncbi:hypothetical protein DYGSA30_00610 [Dyella sp. GSA-30]|nr:hypothetical protein DYGSA30_00610 [Dyella sp. GSA-30]